MLAGGLSKVSVTQAGVAELRWAIRVQQSEKLVGKVNPLLPLDQSLFHIWVTGERKKQKISTNTRTHICRYFTLIQPFVTNGVGTLYQSCFLDVQSQIQGHFMFTG